MQREQRSNRARGEDGFLLIGILALVVPLIVIVVTSSSLIGRRGSQSTARLHSLRAFQAAEAGVDEAVFRAVNGMLTPGAPFTATLDAGCTFTVEPTSFAVDGLDNDGDGSVDELDEQVIELVVTGSFLSFTERLAVHLRTDLMPIPPATIVVHNPAVSISLNGSTSISGLNENIDGSRGDASRDAHGIGMAPPGTLADLAAEITGGEESVVDGLDGWPSLTASSQTFDLPAIVDHYRWSADVTLPAGPYANLQFGSAVAGTPQTTFCSGDIELSGSSTRGCGILVVDGNLEISSQVRFDGLIVLSGNLRMSGGSTIRGALLQGSAALEIADTGGSSLAFSTEALDLAAAVWTGPFTLGSWRVVARD